MSLSIKQINSYFLHDKKEELENQHNTLTRASYSISSKTISTGASKTSVGVCTSSIQRTIVAFASKAFIDI